MNLWNRNARCRKNVRPVLVQDRKAPVRAAITGVHGYLPDYVLGNDELARMVDTSDQWITERTGIKERRILKGEGLGTSHMAAEAVRGLLAKTGTAPEEIDVLVCATITPDFVLPSTANLISNMVGMRHVGSFDVQAACSGFVYGLDVASQFIETGRAKKAILVGADKMSNMIDYTDRTTCVLFGDGAGAVLLEPSDTGAGLVDIELHSDGSGMPHIHQKAGGSRLSAIGGDRRKRACTIFTLERTRGFPRGDRTDVGLGGARSGDAQQHDASTTSIGSCRIRRISAFSKRSPTAWASPHEKVMMTLAEKYGNTTAATIPLCLSRYKSKLKTGDRLVFAAFGGGYTWGSAYLNWAYDGAAGGRS